MFFEKANLSVLKNEDLSGFCNCSIDKKNKWQSVAMAIQSRGRACSLLNDQFGGELSRDIYYLFISKMYRIVQMITV